MTYEARSITGNKYYPEPDCCIETLLSSLGAVTQTFLGLISGAYTNGMMGWDDAPQVHSTSTHTCGSSKARQRGYTLYKLALG